MKPNRLLALALLCAAWFLLLFRLDSVPPGFQHDQTFDSLNALQVVGGQFPLYFPVNFGLAPGFMYAAAGVFKLTGGHYVWALRFTSSIFAMLGLAVSLSFARRYLSPRMASLAIALMAGSYWFIFAGRLGLEVIALLPLAVGCAYFLRRAQDNDRLRSYIVAGALGGAAIYTYHASRTLFALPVALLGYEVAAIGLARLRGQGVPRRSGRRVIGLLATLLAMLIVSGPLLIYIQMHPLVADQRFKELAGPLLAAVQHADFGPVARSFVEAVRALLWDGSAALAYHYNIPGRPILQPVWAVFFLIGLLASLARFFDRREFLLLVALALGLGPTLVTSSDAIMMRSIYALPLIYIVAARGLTASALIVQRLALTSRGRQDSKRFAAPGWLAAVAIAVLLLWQYADNARAYFGEWANNDRTQRIYNADFRLAARYLDASAGQQEIFIGSDRLMELDRQTYNLYEPRRADATWFSLPGNPPLPASGEGVFLGPTTADLPPLLAELVKVGAREERLNDAQGRPLMWVVKVTPETLDQLAANAQLRSLDRPLNYESALRLDAVGWKDEGEEGTLVTRWTALGPWPHPTQPGMPLLQPKAGLALVDEHGYRWAQMDVALAVPVYTAQPGAALLETTAIALPSDAPPGHYSVLLSLYDDTGVSLLMGEGDGPLRQTPIPVTQIDLRLRPLADAPSPPFSVSSPMGGPMQPLGKWEEWSKFVAGAPVAARVSWQAVRALRTADLAFRISGHTESGALLWEQIEPAPGLGGVWEAGRVLRLTHEIAPPEGSPGAITARVAVCAEQGGAILGCASEDRVSIITQPAVMVLPSAPQHETDAQFGGVLTLAGYDIAAEATTWKISLYWQVDEPPAAPLKRFAHLLDKGGQIIGQSDALLVNGDLPTTAWRPGEFITESFELIAPAGQPADQLCVGLYDATTEARLEGRSGAGEPIVEGRLCLR